MLTTVCRCSTPVLRVTSLVCLIAAAGCDAPEAKYVPEVDTARASLTAALDAWKAGKPVEPFTSGETKINVVDSRWQSGKKLDQYEIVGEVAGQPHRTFTVRLTIAGQDQPEETQYFILGINPLFIYREADYGQPAGM